MGEIKSILVFATSDDEWNYKLLSWASRLRELTGARIDVLQVIDPGVEQEIDEVRTSPFLTYDSYFASDQLIQNALDLAKVRMAQIRLDFQIERAACHIIPGEPCAIVVEFTQNRACDLVVTGIDGQHSMLSRHLTARSHTLVSHLDIPVLLVPDHAPLRHHGAMHVLFASDLRSDSSSYLEQALSWSHEIHATKFTALHVVPEKSQIGKIWEGFRSLVGDGEHRMVIEHHEHRAQVKSDLRQQVKKIAKKALANKGMRLTSMALEGDVCDELSRAIRRTMASILCLGRHAFFHKDDVSFGRIPFRRLGEFGVPVLLCQDQPAAVSERQLIACKAQAEVRL